jgi:peptidoglycan/xylan/chitin deacetylase (PgdA/CDA1 family)
MNLRHLAKTVAAETLCRTGVERLWSAPAAPRALVLGYHQVVEDERKPGPSIPAMVISTAMLERQLDWVGRHFRFVSLDELGRLLESGAAGERPPAAVTFDDGYRDVYEHALPLLRRKGIPAAVFVVTDLVGTGRLMTHDRLHLLLARQHPRDAFTVMRGLLASMPSARLEHLMQALEPAGGWPEDEFSELRALDWDMVRTMHRAGFTIGSHTSTHALLTLEAPDRVRQELWASRRRLEDELGAPVRHFAYPDGRFDGGVVDAVAEAGYAFAYTTCRHRDRRHPFLTVPRRLLWENSCRDAAGRFSPSLMRGQVRGLFDLFGRCRQDHRSPRVRRLSPAIA